MTGDSSPSDRPPEDTEERSPLREYLLFWGGLGATLLGLVVAFAVVPVEISGDGSWTLGSVAGAVFTTVGSAVLYGLVVVVLLSVTVAAVGGFVSLVTRLR